MRIPASIRAEYGAWRRLLDEEVDFFMGASVLHTKAHCARVLLYCLMMAQRRKLPAADRSALCAAAVFHDSRRLDDGLDVGHGARAAEYYREFCRARALPCDERACKIMAFHDRSDELGLAELSGAGNGALLYQIFKDADALDRWRLGPDGLDAAYLRTPEARALTAFSKVLVEEAAARGG